jgi:glutathione synthase/RimK-type ligase-like ATP-grasp enzyme
VRAAVLRCEKLPSFVTVPIEDLDDLFADDRMLVAELEKRGAKAELIAWTDPNIDWNDFDVAVIRSTWDYIDDRERFLKVLASIAASSCMLLNPLEIVSWNTDKSYLFDLAKWDIPIVPTLRASEEKSSAIQDEIIRRGWQSAVIKPTIGAGGSDVRLVPSADLAATLERLAAERPDTGRLVQPLVENIRTEGELSFVYIDGNLNHVLRKLPAPGDFRSHGMYGGTMQSIEPRSGDRAEADAIMKKLPFRPLYTRLDLVRVDGHLAVMELELIEPVLYFDFAPEGAGRLAAAALDRLRSRARPAGESMSQGQDA